MPEITNIPEPFRPGLKDLVSIDNKVLDELLTKLQDIPPSLDDSESILQLVQNFTAVSSDDIRNIIDTLYGLSMARITSDVPILDFVRDIADALERQRVKDISLSPEARPQFEDRLATLLNLDVFRLGAKAANVLFEFEHVFMDARILTDIRPLFGDDVKSLPIGAVIVHSLKIEYRDSEGLKEFFISLDARDAQVLTDVLERAKSKAESLRSFLSATQTPLIDFE